MASMNSTRIKRMHETLDRLDAAANANDGRVMLNELHALMHDAERISIVANLLLDIEKRPAAA